LPLWELDDGIIEGALLSRYPEGGNIIVRKDKDADKNELWRYTLIFTEEVENEAN
jgi:hypothetical protein